MAKVITGKVRFSYASVFTPKAMQEGSTPKYSVAVLIPKSDKDTIAKIQKAIKEALEEGKASVFAGKIPATWKNPLRDGDEERPDDQNYAGHYFMNCSSSNKPGVVGPDLEPIMSQDDFYSGCYGRVSVVAFAYENEGGVGVAFGLQNVQKIKDGERLGQGKAKPEDDFEPIKPKAAGNHFDMLEV